MLLALDCKPTSGHLLCCSIATQSYLLMSALSRGVYQSDTAMFIHLFIYSGIHTFSDALGSTDCPWPLSRILGSIDCARLYRFPLVSIRFL
jgi:hypothetical protein